MKVGEPVGFLLRDRSEAPYHSVNLLCIFKREYRPHGYIHEPIFRPSHQTKYFDGHKEFITKFETTLKRILQKGVDSLLLDLTWNGGGNGKPADATARMLLPKGASSPLPVNTFSPCC